MKKRTRLGLRPRLAGLTTAAIAAACLILGVPAALGVTGAINTTDDPGYTGGLGAPNAACLNGQPGHTDPATNCNIYSAKTDVFLSGSPVTAALGSGTYFFAVLVPGGQPDANDGSAKNLSDDFDSWSDRKFSVSSSGSITNLGTHAFDAARNLLQMAPYADTTNPGGVYILAVCKVPSSPTDSPGVSAKDCKYDAFKVKAGTPPTGTADDLAVLKDATPSFTRTFGWTIDKGVDACEVTQAHPNGCTIQGTTQTLNYTVTVTKDGGTDSAWDTSGTITVTNPNADDVTGVSVDDQVTYGASDTVDANANCKAFDTGTGNFDLPFPVTGQTVPASGTLSIDYDCAYTAAPANVTETNTASATWSTQCLESDGAGNCTLNLPGNTQPWPVVFNWTNPTSVVHDSVTLSDLYTTTPNPLPAGFGAALSSGSLPSGTINSSQTFNYAYLVTVPHDCVKLDNTATFTDATYTGSDSVTGKVCRTPPNTGALTMGFWQNKNGQGIISGGLSVSGVCKSGTWLRQFAPFQDLSATASCSAVATYVSNIIKAANASGSSMNAMLKAQMLATALDVYFSDPALGTNKINAPSPIGGFVIDLTQICKMIDGSGGTATCSGTYQNASSAFGGATQLTVLQILTYAAGQSNAGGSSWYGQVKAIQELAKNTFDAINNKVAFTV